MCLNFLIDNREIKITSFNKNFAKGWGSVLKVTGDDALTEIGLMKEFYFKCDSAYNGTFTYNLKDKDGYQPLNPPENWQQNVLFLLLSDFVKSGKEYF